MADLFNRQTEAYGGSFAADGAFITFASPGVGAGAGLVGVEATRGSPSVGLLTQNIQISYQQQILRLYEIGTRYHFFVAGRTSGQLSVGRVLGPRPISIAFYRKFGDVCNAATNIIDLTMATGCNAPGQNAQIGSLFTLRILFAVINSIAISMNSQDSLISEQLQMMFCSMTLSGGVEELQRVRVIQAASIAAAVGLGAIGGVGLGVQANGNPDAIAGIFDGVVGFGAR